MWIKSSQLHEQDALAKETTPRAMFESRRVLLKGLTGAGLSLSAMGSNTAFAQSTPVTSNAPKALPLIGAHSNVAGAYVVEKATSQADASSYNNYYEFGTDKGDPVKNAHTLKTTPWSVQVEGLVKKPMKITLEDLLKVHPMEERIYRMRCVEGWSMVIPWVGYSMSELINKVEPLGNAKYVEFVSLADPKTMPFVGSGILDWPYTEGLRLDEAMHPLTLLTFGMW